MILYVVTWFRREPLADAPRYGTGWAQGIAAFTTEAEASAAFDLQVGLGRLHAGEGHQRRRLEDLGASSADLVAYTLAGPPTLELLAAVVSSPPRGDTLARLDPLAGASSWWASAHLARSWWGGTDPEARASRNRDRDR